MHEKKKHKVDLTLKTKWGIIINKMKNLFLGLFMLAGTAMFASNSVEASEEKKEVKVEVSKSNESAVFVKTCRYAVINTRGERVGTVIMSDVPDNVDCGSASALQQAQNLWDNAK